MKKIIGALLIIIIIATTAVFLIFKTKQNKTQPQSKNTSQEIPVVAQIASSDFAVNLEGNIVPRESNDYIQLFLPQETSPQAGQKLEDPTSTFAIELAGLLKKSDFHATSIRIIAQDNILVYDQKQTIAYFSAQKDPREQVNTLQRVLAEARIDDDKIDKIDLRFENPVISEK